jgi:hypothetical protein
LAHPAKTGPSNFTQAFGDRAECGNAFRVVFKNEQRFHALKYLLHRSATPGLESTTSAKHTELLGLLQAGNDRSPRGECARNWQSWIESFLRSIFN